MSLAQTIDRYHAMRERAVEAVAMKVKDLLSEQWRPLQDAGWNDEDIRVILDKAVEQCGSQP